ncbi:hypothetical protein DQ04_16541000 [Trypanosoma grayi]|uniref:hypothetical protein n=1 Tax=Trypanosoma grayi TaxID=71804 RepID=UPI0004F4BC21|nr:hypothetical protein DQ04_16541000 [Trypanosoma grayi]KEG06014.1 hypothetical protein DQ04_16541000 [Trypanosoma grayi]
MMAGGAEPLTQVVEPRGRNRVGPPQWPCARQPWNFPTTVSRWRPKQILASQENSPSLCDLLDFQPSCKTNGPLHLTAEAHLQPPFHHSCYVVPAHRALTSSP